MFRYIFFVLSILVLNSSQVSAAEIAKASDNKSVSDSVKTKEFTIADVDIPDDTWTYRDENGDLKVNLYFFWSRTCPHCRKAYPFVSGTIPKEYSWVTLHSHMVANNNSRKIWKKIARYAGKEAKFVPLVVVCGKAISGYGTDESTGKYIQKTLKACYEANGGAHKETLSKAANSNIIKTSTAITPKQLDLKPQKKNQNSTSDCDDEKEICAEDQLISISLDDLGLDNSADASKESATANGSVEQKPLMDNDVQPVDIPFLGVVQPENLSLPVLTVVLAGVDAFNPCAFFVLLFLLSIMVNAKSRARMLIVGGIFVFFSGLIYFLFMTAWLNVFEFLGGGDGGIIIKTAGLVALIAAIINMKEFFFEKGEVSLSMSADNRSGLIKRMGKLSSASSMGAMIFGTTVLAILANAYELLCTAGFPMIYTSVLTMNDLPSVSRYMYLVFYNVVYVIPLALIVLVFTLTLGKRKLSEKEGKTLKLMSGIMMFGLGGTLVVNPNVLQSVTYAVGLIFSSIVMTFVILFIKKRCSSCKG